VRKSHLLWIASLVLINTLVIYVLLITRTEGGEQPRERLVGVALLAGLLVSAITLLAFRLMNRGKN
jgi:RsiW-degrading membrane proteinase PrsW (M82 family)